MKAGVLLVNLGSPAAPTPAAVKTYLRQFLMDPYVIDISAIARFFLVQFIIAPFRAPKSAEAYAKIWKGKESPLIEFSKKLEGELHKKLNEKFKDGFQVALG